MNTRARKFLIFLIGAVILIPTAVSAASIDTGSSNYNLPANQTREGNLYLTHQQSTVSGHVTGDLVIASGNVIVSGPVDKSIIVLGGRVDIRGPVGESIRALAGQVTISSAVRGDLLVASGQVSVDQGASIGGDALVATGNFDLAGKVGGDLRIYSGQTTLEGTIDGSVYAIVKHLKIAERAQIGHNLSYTARQEAEIAPSAKVGGKVSFAKSSQSFYSSVSAAGIIFKLLMLAVAVLVILALFPGASTRTAEEVNQRFLSNLLIGFLFLVLTPIVVFLIFLTVVGIYLALLLTGIYLLLLGFGFVGASLVIGYVVVRRLGDGEMNLYLTGLLGVALLVLLSAIPILGGLAVFILFCATLGALLRGMRSGPAMTEPTQSLEAQEKPKRPTRRRTTKR